MEVGDRCPNARPLSSQSSHKTLKSNKAADPPTSTALNEELNRILETERKIKEYKELLTKMQREMYSKKQGEHSEPPR